MRLRGRIEAVPALDNGVDDVLKELEALLIAAREANAEMRPEHASLHAVGQSAALGRLDILELLEKLGSHGLAHQRLVSISERRQLGEGDVLELVSVLNVRRRSSKLGSEPRIKRSIDLGQLESNDLSSRGRGSKLLLEGDELLHTVNHLLHQLHLRQANTLLVRDVPLTTHGSTVLA